ncbi:MAG: hypothetical protein CMH24_00770 [Nitrosomonadales bacterium]|nr:hypothetical protein [Nitrosomonadales bacterium]|tara:strand:+ start:219 stop:1769 length:1551 start_codon:yes stop_codon:yes gene_type:complete
MSKFVQELSEYADLVKKFGRANISNNQNLVDKLTFNEVSYWDVFSAEMCWRHLTTASSAKSIFSFFKLFIKPKFIIIREWLIRKKIKNSFKKKRNNHLPKNAIIFLAFMPRMYLDILHPVILSLKKDKKAKIVVLTDQSGSFISLPKIQGVIYRDIWSFWDKDLDSKSKSFKKIVLKKINSIYSEIQKGDSNKFLFGKHGKALKLSLKVLFNGYIPLILEQAIISEYILNKYKPKKIISPDASDARTRIYKLIGKNLNIPSLDIQFGLTGPEGVEWKFFVADKVAVWGKSSKDNLIKHGIKKEKILITGSPRHDALVFPNKKILNNLRDKYKLNSNQKIILYASTYTDKSHHMFSNSNVLDDMKLAVFETAKAFPNLTFLVKPHPVEDIHESFILGKSCKNVIFIDKKEDISLLIHLSDYFLSFGSTSTIDALIINKLSICPIFPGWPFSKFFEKSKAVLIPRSKEELLNIFYKISIGKDSQEKNLQTNTRDFIKNHTYKNDGMSSFRIKNLILKF